MVAEDEIKVVEEVIDALVVEAADAMINQEAKDVLAEVVTTIEVIEGVRMTEEVTDALMIAETDALLKLEAHLVLTDQDVLDVNKI